ncbi:Hypothetical predicted protein, partial [Podarcis lilfordi]
MGPGKRNSGMWLREAGSPLKETHRLGNLPARGWCCQLIVTLEAACLIWSQIIGLSSSRLSAR